MEPRHRLLGMTDDELSAIVSLLGRDPTDLELAMYSVMWSEHCSYKSSRKYLGRFPTEAPWVLVGPGEGAGVIDVGDDLAVALRIESHNHPSAGEPHQGSWTRCVSAPSTAPATVIWLKGWSPGSPAMAIRSACRPWAVRSSSTPATALIPW